MGRLVIPISREEFEKLPKWQQAIGNHPYAFLGGLIAVMAAMVAVAVLCNQTILTGN